MISRSFSILGIGNVAWQLAQHLRTNNLQIDQVISRNEETGRMFADDIRTNWVSLANFKEADALLICIPEGAVESTISNQLFTCNWAVHTAGSLPMNALASIENHGVFYPIQTMSKARLLNAESITMCLEANSLELEKELKQLAETLGFKHYLLNSEQRIAAHLAAVMVNNFSNHLWHKAADFAQENGIDFKLLEPLVQESFDKFRSLGGHRAQTGPARRHDDDTIEKHIEMLQEHVVVQKLYEVFTQSIKDEFERE